MVHCTKRVAGTGQADVGAVGEVSLLTVLTLQPGVTHQTRTLTGALITVVHIQYPLAVTAAVTMALWVDERERGDKKMEKTA